MRPSKLLLAVVPALFSAFTAHLSAETLPQMRPSLIGSGPHSLVNLIDTEKLFRRGQRDGWVMFKCLVFPDGLARQWGPLRKSEGADALKGELATALIRTRFIPAIYNRKPTYSLFVGTAIFAVVGGRPHVRIFANQEMDELKRNSDFVAPQIVDAQDAKFFGPDTPGHAAYLGQGGIVKVRHSVDANGKTMYVNVLSEAPLGEKFGAAVRDGVLGSIYIPAYRNGKPTASTLTYEIIFGY